MKISDPKGLINKQFTCPQCGSHYFRTINQKTIPWKRQCKGHYLEEYRDYKGCSYTWFGDKDDNVFKDK